MLEATTRGIRHLIHNRKYWCLFFIFLAINLIVIHRSLAEPGLILAGDFTRAEDFSKFVSTHLYPMWDENAQRSNLPTLFQLQLFAPAILVASVIDIPTTLVYLVYFSVLGSLAGVFSFKLTEYVMVRQHLNPRFEFCLVSSLFFMFATFVVETTFHPGIAFSFYLLPLLLYALIRGIEEDRISYLLLTSVIYSLTVHTLHFVVFGLIIILSYIIFDLLYKMIVHRSRSFSAVKRAVGYTLIVLGPFIVLNSYWLIPNLAFGGLELYPNLLTEEGSTILYRNADIISIFSIKGDFELYSYYPFSESELAYINILSIALTVIAISSLLLYKQNKLLIYLAILLFLSVIISVIPYYLPDLYNWFIFDIPGSSVYSWVFRTPKFFHFMSISIAVMLSLSGLRIYQILYRQEKRFSKAVPPIFIAIVLVFVLVPNNILLTGDFNGFHESYELPQDYNDVLTFLEGQDGNYKSIWGPRYAGLSSTWNDNPIGKLEEQISPTNTFSSVQTLNNYIYPVIFGIRFPYGSMVYHEQTNSVNEFLAPLGVKHIVLHDDVPGLESRIDKLSNALNKQRGLIESDEFGPMTLYTIEDAAEQFSIKQSTMLIQGGFLKFDSVSRIEDINSRSIGALFSDMDLEQNLERWNSSDTVIPEKELSYSEYMLQKNDVIVISPFDYTNHFAPQELWSKSSANRPAFLDQLYGMGIEPPYQFDYGKGIVLTSADNSRLSIPLSGSDAGEYKVLLRYFANDKGGLLDLALGGKSQRLETTSHLNRFVWTDLGTIRLSDGTETLSIENRNGFNALNLIALIPAEKYENYKSEFTNSLRDKDVMHIFEAESDFNIDGFTSPPVVQEVDYSNGKALELRTQDIASTNFEILKDGMYNLTISGQGTVTIDIDGTIMRTVNLAKDRAYVEPIALNSGNHYMSMASTNGTNSSYLDSIFIRSIETNTDDPSSLVQQPGEEAIISYNKIDPTNYEVSVKAESPFMLAFAEAYDNRWIAEIEETSSGIKKVYKPLPLYGAINGFMIDTEGDYVVHIKYAPQEIFIVAAWISAVSYAFVIIYLVRVHHLIFRIRRNNS